MMDKPKCPYCGAEMRYYERRIKGYEYMGYYFCRKCESRAPRVNNFGIDAADMKEVAEALAAQRYQEPNRVLTLNELAEMEDCHSIYFETTGLGWDCGSVFESSVACAKETFCDEDEGAGAKKEYGVKVRCWLRRPTGEERQNTPWEAPPC